MLGTKPAERVLDHQPVDNVSVMRRGVVRILERHPSTDPATPCETDRLVTRDPRQPGLGTGSVVQAPSMTQCLLEGRLHRIGRIVAVAQDDQCQAVESLALS